MAGNLTKAKIILKKIYPKLYYITFKKIQVNPNIYAFKLREKKRNNYKKRTMQLNNIW